MMLIRINVLVLFISSVSSLQLVVTKNPNNYGPYTINWGKYEICEGPKAKTIAVTVSSLKIDEYSAIASYNISFHTVVKIEEIKVVVYSLTGNRKNSLWNYKLTKPCQHFLIASKIDQMYHSRNCIIQPNDYYNVVNYTEVAYTFFGTSFFYGEYAFKMNALTRHDNILCIYVDAKFLQKNK